MPAVGKYIRTEKHKKIMSKAQSNRYQEAKAQLERYKEAEEKNKPKENKFNSVNNRIENMDKEELCDLVAGIRYQILAKVKELGKNLKGLQNLQEKRDHIEGRLEELGIRIKD